MKRKIKRLFVMLAAVILCVSCSFGQETQAASKNSVSKVLSYYKKGQYTKAQKIANKLSKKASEKCVTNMKKEVKKAYLKKLKSYKKNVYGRCVQCYYLTDIDKDGTPELLVQYGRAEADMELHLYTYKKKKVVTVVKEHLNHSSFFAYPDGNGVIVQWTFMGGESLTKLMIKNGKTYGIDYGYRAVDLKKSEYLQLPYALKWHTSYSDLK